MGSLAPPLCWSHSQSSALLRVLLPVFLKQSMCVQGTELPNLRQQQTSYLLYKVIQLHHATRLPSITERNFPFRDGKGTIPWAAILCTTASLVVPSSASIFNEWALKRDTETSIHLQNFFLYSFGLAFNSLGAVVVSLRSSRSIASLFAGQNKVFSPADSPRLRHLNVPKLVHRLKDLCLLRNPLSMPLSLLCNMRTRCHGKFLSKTRHDR